MEMCLRIDCVFTVYIHTRIDNCTVHIQVCGYVLTIFTSCSMKYLLITRAICESLNPELPNPFVVTERGHELLYFILIKKKTIERIQNFKLM